MIGGDWELESQTPETNNMEIENGMCKTDQREFNRKLGNNDQNQQKKYNLRSRKVNDIVGNSKPNDVDFPCIETDESNENDEQENEDYVEMVQVYMNCISGHSTNVAISGHGFIKAKITYIKCSTFECNIINFF